MGKGNIPRNAGNTQFDERAVKFISWVSFREEMTAMAQAKVAKGARRPFSFQHFSFSAVQLLPQNKAPRI
jgi:hypothetical protein